MAIPIKPILFAAIILSATVSAAYTLTLLDKIVHGQLYNYGLQFSLEWSTPYWSLLRITLTLLLVAAVSTVVSVVFTLRKHAFVKKPNEKVVISQKSSTSVQSPAHPIEKTPLVPVMSSTTTTSTVPASVASGIPELIRCSHCGKAFTQPLRMLDFQSDRPRIVKICPFCNEIIPSSVPNRDEKESEKKFQFKKKNNNHAAKAVASHSTS